MLAPADGGVNQRQSFDFSDRFEAVIASRAVTSKRRCRRVSGNNSNGFRFDGPASQRFAEESKKRGDPPVQRHRARLRLRRRRSAGPLL